MEKVFERVGEVVVLNLWLNDAVDEVLVESLFIYTMLQVVCIAGLYGIFAKLHTRKSWAFIPGVNVARLGSLCGCPAAGVIVALCKIGFLVAAEATVRVYLIPLTLDSALNRHCTITVFLAAALFLIRSAAGFVLYSRMIRRFGESRWWLIPFLLFPNVTTLFFGFNPNIMA